MENLKDKSVGEIVASDYRTSDIFRNYGIDFCCGGKKSLQRVCEQHHLNLTEIEQEITSLMSGSGSPAHRFDSWDLDFLADYIMNTHHRYVEKEVMVIYEYAKKVASVHGNRHPEMIEVAELFYAVAQELISHMRREELILFPYIRELAKGYRQKTAVEKPVFMTAENPIHAMISEHESAGAILRRIGGITNSYAPPADACNTFRVLLSKLNEFEIDLHTHVHLENNILFPKAVALEKQVEFVV